MINKEWSMQTTMILKGHLMDKNMRYHDLATALKQIGIEENQNTIATKLSRGTFSFAFFLQCMYVLEIRTIDLDYRV